MTSRFGMRLALLLALALAGCAGTHGVICLETAAELAADPQSCQ